MLLLSKLGDWASQVLLPLGGYGLFLAAVLDSSFVPLPHGVDLWLITLSVWQPERMPWYVVVATAGSSLGCSVLYLVARWGEERFVETNPKYKGLPRIRRWVEKYEFWTVMVGAILPPPMPLKLVVIAAGLVRGRFEKFLLAIVIGRLVRYGGEGFLAVRYGSRIWPTLVRLGPFLLGAALLLVAVLLLMRRLRRPVAE